MQFDWQTYTEQLAQAVEAEIQFQYEEEKKQAALPLNELRKLGLVLSPVTIKQQVATDEGETIVFQTSYPINDAYFKKGCQVAISVENKLLKGRIIELEAQNGSIFLTEELPDDTKTIAIHYIPDDRTLTAMRLGVKIVKEHPQIDVFQSDFERTETATAFLHASLNESQQNVVGAILSDKQTTVIQGPPGTGKSHTLAIAIQEIIKHDKKVIIAAPSNTAVDQLCLKLISLGTPVLRIGNETKFDERLLAFTIDGYLEKGSQAKVLAHLEKSLQQASHIANKYSRSFSKELAEEKRNARNELRQLRKEIRQLKRTTILSLLENVPVIAGTPVALFNELPKDFITDYVIVDEAGQALAPLAWLCASFGKQFVLCGDPQQLPPFVFSDKAKRLGLGMSLLEQVAQLSPPYLLNTQYRMAPTIVALINPYFYNNQLQTPSTLSEGTIRFIDLAGFGEGETRNELSGSISNSTAVSVIQQLLVADGFDPKETIILSPYSAQIAALKTVLGPTWNVATIDAVQGSEMENIVICFTRSNEEQEIGFLKDYRRTNVAISRAKKKCYLIGDSATIGADKFYSELIRHFENSNNYESVWERFSDY